MNKEELKQILIDNMELRVQINKDECVGTIIAVSIYFDNEKILSSEDYI